MGGDDTVRLCLTSLLCIFYSCLVFALSSLSSFSQHAPSALLPLRETPCTISKAHLLFFLIGKKGILGIRIGH